MVGSACVPEESGGGGAVITIGADCTSPPTITPGALLSGCNLMGFNLSNSDLSGADLRGANLTGANLANSDLTNADLTGANLTNANLTGADLTGAVLAGAILLGAIFVGAILTGTSFSFGEVFGNDGQGGTNAPASDQCVGPFCPGYNEVVAPQGPGREICSTTPSFFGDDDDDYPADNLFELGIFIVADNETLEENGLRSVVTDEWTDFSGAVFDYSDDPDGTAAIHLAGLNMARADFTGATFIDAYIACKNADGGRFANTRFLPTDGVGVGMGGFFHTSMVGADLTNAEFINMYFCDADFTNASMQSLDIGGFSVFSCPEMLTAEEINLLPYHLAIFDDADMTGATFGVVPNPGDVVPIGDPGVTATILTMPEDAHVEGSEAKAASFVGTTLDDARFHGVMMGRANFTDASADGVEVTRPEDFFDQNMFDEVIFGTGWTNTTWSGSTNFDGAVCPDGSIGSSENPCFTIIGEGI